MAAEVMNVDYSPTNIAEAAMPLKPLIYKHRWFSDSLETSALRPPNLALGPPKTPQQIKAQMP
jgi:hypothetical protein